MGFWDSKLADLEALGIRFDPLMEKALEGEVNVMHLHHMLSPFSTPEYQEGCYDQAGDPVFVIEPVRSYSPTGVTEYKNAVLSEVNDYWGDEGWMDVPCVLGYLEQEDRYNAWCYHGWNHHRAEQMTPYRFYMCYPMVDDSVYESLARACDHRLADGFYYDIDEMTFFESSDDDYIDLGSLWLFENDPQTLKPDELKHVTRWLQDNEPEEGRRLSAMAAYERLVENNVVPPPWPDMAKNWRFEGLPFKPMEHYLRNEPLAMEIWNILLAQRQYATARITSTMSPRDRDRFIYHEEYI